MPLPTPRLVRSPAVLTGLALFLAAPRATAHDALGHLHAITRSDLDGKLTSPTLETLDAEGRTTARFETHPATWIDGVICLELYDPGWDKALATASELVLAGHDTKTRFDVVAEPDGGWLLWSQDKSPRVIGAVWDSGGNEPLWDSGGNEPLWDHDKAPR